MARPARYITRHFPPHAARHSGRLRGVTIMSHSVRCRFATESRCHHADACPAFQASAVLQTAGLRTSSPALKGGVTATFAVPAYHAFQASAATCHFPVTSLRLSKVSTAFLCSNSHAFYLTTIFDKIIIIYLSMNICQVTFIQRESPWRT